MNTLSWPAYVALELTPVCSNRCPGCSNVYADDRSGGAAPASRWRAWLEMFAPEAVQLRLTGGEPTLHPEFQAIFDAAISYQAWVTVFTNGRWRDPQRFLAGVRGRSRFSGLLISLHGPAAAAHEAFSNVRGSFDETVANIRRASEAGVPSAISCVLTRHNWDRVEEMLALGQALGAGHVTFNRYLGAPLPGLEASPEQIRHAAGEIGRLEAEGQPVQFGVVMPHCFCDNSSTGCLAGAAYAAIDPSGRLHPCTHSETFAGSLDEAGFQDLWLGPVMEAWRARIPAGCAECAAFSGCHGGCRALQEIRPEGDPLRREPLQQYAPRPLHKTLPGRARPVLFGRMRSEAFGHALLGDGTILPVSPAALPVLQACDGSLTFAELAARFGPAGLNLLGEMWERGLIVTAGEELSRS